MDSWRSFKILEKQHKSISDHVGVEFRKFSIYGVLRSILVLLPIGLKKSTVIGTVSMIVLWDFGIKSDCMEGGSPYLAKDCT